MSVPLLECWLFHYCRLSMVSRIVANLVTQRRTRHSLGLRLMRVHCLGNKCLTAIVYSRHTQALLPTHAQSHTLALSSRVCDTNLLQQGRMRHWAPNELVSRKLHYLSLAVADKARRDGPIVPAPCCTYPPLPEIMLPAAGYSAMLFLCPAKSSLGCSAATLTWRWLSPMRHCSVTHANFKTLSKSQQFFCSISALCGRGLRREGRSKGCCCYGNCCCCCCCCILIAQLGVPLGPLILHKLCTEIT